MVVDLAQFTVNSYVDYDAIDGWETEFCCNVCKLSTIIASKISLYELVQMAITHRHQIQAPV